MKYCLREAVFLWSLTEVTQGETAELLSVWCSMLAFDKDLSAP